MRNTILCVVGARPNFMKIAPIMRSLGADTPFPARLVHTGQHYDAAMNTQYFEALGIPQPDINLEVGSGTHAVQTAEVMRRFEPVLDQENPAAVLVVGDVNSTLACALVAAKKGCPVIHVEAGLRSFDRTMPEEINRILTDQLSDLLFTTEKEAETNLAREGIDVSRVRFVGNVMIDTLLANLKNAIPAAQSVDEAGLTPSVISGKNGFAVLTLHRPSNVDDPLVLESLLQTVAVISTDMPVLFPVHPRTRMKITEFGLDKYLAGHVHCLPPLGYLHLLGLMKDARVVLTDSGGIQEETTALGVPCLTLRNNTERPITVSEGTNTIVGQDPERILEAFGDILRNGGKTGRIPALWDGQAAQRIATALQAWLSSTHRKVA